MNYHSTTNAQLFNDLPINTGNNNQFFCYDIVLQKIYERLEWMIAKHNKVLFVRFDLRFPYDYLNDTTNKKISGLFKIITDYYKYHLIDLQFLWVREQSREKHQHYHCVLLLDGNKVKNYYSILDYVSRSWGLVLDHHPDGLVDFCTRDRSGSPVENGIMIRRPSSKVEGEELIKQQQKFNIDLARCFEWASYLAKMNQKSNTPPHLRRFGVSQLD